MRTFPLKHVLAGLALLLGFTTSAAGENWTIGATTYESVRVREVSAGSVTIFHRKGITQLDLAKLPPDLQTRFAYDPERAGEWKASVARELSATREAQLQATEARRRQHADAIEDPADPVATATATPSAPTTVNLLPDVDLRPIYTRHGLIFKDQGRRPSCSIFALVSALEFEYARISGRSDSLSEEFLLWAVRQLHPGIATDNGFHFREVVSALQAFGIPRQSAMPNTFGKPIDQIEPTAEAIFDASTRRDIVPVWYRTDAEDVLARIVHALNNGTPVVVGMRWPNWRTLEGNHLLLKQQPRGGPGHAVTLVGYRCPDGNPENLVFTFRNSYGINWGTGGCGFVAASYLHANLLGAFHLTTPERVTAVAGR